MELATSDEINMDTAVKISIDGLTRITDHGRAFPDAYTDDNLISHSDITPAANLHDNDTRHHLTSLEQVVTGHDPTGLEDHSEQRVLKTTVSVGVQVNLCGCEGPMCTPILGEVKPEADNKTMSLTTFLNTETNDIDAIEHLGEDQFDGKQSGASEPVQKDLLLTSTKKVFVTLSTKDAKREAKKRRKIEKASKKQKQPKVLTRRSTKSTLERRYMCEGCGIRFVHKATYDRHLLELRGKASEHKCSHCESTFSFLCKLKQHIAAKHPELTSPLARERPVICHICGIQLQTSVSMNKHMRIHDGDKPFVCKYCPKTFRWHTGLEYHERIHTGERPFKCPNCPKAFTNPSDMARHQTVHTGKKPHLCHQCGKGFTQGGTLNAHIKSKHMRLASPLSRPTMELCNLTSTELVTVSSEPKSSDIPLCQFCGRYFVKHYLLEMHIRKSHQQQLIPNSAIEGGMCCSTLEDMKLQLASCTSMNQNTGFNLPTCIPTEREIAEVVVNMLAQ